ncbi:hypothetical protein BKA82DRAFT_169089 [Pisolithus tinctorius]|uniref:Uncharacterized protein n=1 Tax=Pisolithus tinctorius Marx 270 TaxID=870435 RepID=A0A0C3NED1_PISTI|nr:hypothetical protein BKA82DRAFT_169089 [Pisolithus tinctorius]KIN94130.1 hypothetical protein M404DRAFT_169089 [Pisolithus tinctorius Marx 270]
MSPLISIQSSTSGDINTLLPALTDAPATSVPCEAPLTSSSVLESLKDSTFAIYAATPNLAARAEFFFGGATGDIAVLKTGSDDVTELVISGVFEIDRQGFFMGPEGGYMAKNAFAHEFVDTKLTCNLLAVQCDAVYGITQQDFPSIISNIRALEKLVPLKKGESLLSCIRESHSQPCIHLSHALFNKKEDDDDPKSISCNGLYFHVLASDIATAEWPVQDVLRDALNQASGTHYISPLPAFDVDGEPIQPVDYHRLLCGAIVQVHFAILHFFIKGDRKSVFTTALREMHVLRAPLQAPINPLKHARQSNESPSASTKRSRPVRLPYMCCDAISCLCLLSPSCDWRSGLSSHYELAMGASTKVHHVNYCCL